MQITSGTIIISTPALHETIFEQSIIVITESNADGAIGFVINQLFPRTLNQLEEFKLGLTFPLYNGGPVEQEGLYFIHRSNNLIEGGTLVKEDLFIGGNFKQVVSLLNSQNIGENDIKIFVGYCGWDKGELAAEIAEGSWLITEEKVEQIFKTDNLLNWNLLYQKLVSKQ